ncbi:ROK family transcriptional regulator [Paenibacillus dendritiformis]|uniref:ROK family transcriptional regulator n=1 Tax=Paenibacillus TaxID=44249 RepID=UPI00248C1EF4|nr:ROK family transcriptional regulator [Paenibacillus dendritiformis]WGU95091.1 ROK family transcriptional regulator [Paenibacillus dendritiformis]
MKHVRGNVHLMKEINRATILSLLHREKAMSRADMAKVTKLSATTVSSLVDELIDEGYIVESGAQSSAGAGRKAIRLEISKDKGFVISVGLGNHLFYCTLSNFHSEIVAELTVPAVKGNDEVLQTILHCISEIVQLAGISDFSQIKGIGIASPGIVDESSGTITYARFLQLKDFEIVKLLQARYVHLPVYVMNDTNAAAFAEYYRETSPGVKHVLYVWVYEGVGARMIVNGQVYSGYKGRAGEVSLLHDRWFSIAYVLEQAKQRAAKRGLPVPHTIEDVVQAYERGEDWVEPLMNRSLLFLSRALAVMMNLFGPEKTILDGWFMMSPKCMQSIHDHLARFTVDGGYDSSWVAPASLGKRNYVIGVTTMVLQQLFKGKVSVT